MRKIESVKLDDRNVLVRCDFNVPLDKNGNIISYKRIDSAKQTIDYLLNKNCKIVLCSHMGRPNGKIVNELSLKCVYNYLQQLYPSKVFFCDKLNEIDINKAKKMLNHGEILLLENLRFDVREEENDNTFAEMLAEGMDYFVDEAFAIFHRKSASNSAIKKLLPSVMGFNYSLEVQALTLKDKQRPILAILGGAKVSDKIELISKLVEKVDNIFIGGALANTFMYALGYNINENIVEKDKKQIALKIINKAKKLNKQLVFPKDVYVLTQNGDKKLKNISNLLNLDVCLDIGKESVREIKGLIMSAKTIFWNGPLGKTSDEKFEWGTKKVAQLLAQSSAYTIIGGGDSVAEVEKYNLQNKINFVSTGGGASLKYIQRG